MKEIDRIKIENGELFEGALSEFKSCYFDNADEASIMKWCKDNDYDVEITYTDKEATDWTAVYLPSRSDGQDITKSGFKTAIDAERYARRFYCKNCRHLVALALTWKRRYGINAHEASKAVCNTLTKLATKDLSLNTPYGLDFEVDTIFGNENGDACGCEWIIIPTEEYNKCEDFGDIMEAAGAKKI